MEAAERAEREEKGSNGRKTSNYIGDDTDVNYSYDPLEEGVKPGEGVRVTRTAATVYITNDTLDDILVYKRRLAGDSFVAQLKPGERQRYDADMGSRWVMRRADVQESELMSCVVNFSTEDYVVTDNEPSHQEKKEKKVSQPSKGPTSIDRERQYRNLLHLPTQIENQRAKWEE